MKGNTYNALLEEARNQHMSLNAVVGKVLEDYGTFERYIKNLDMVCITSSVFELFVESCAEDKIGELGKQLAKVRSELIPIWFGEINPRSTYNFVVFFCEKSGIAKFTEFKEPHAGVVGFHKLGPKGSRMLKSFIQELFALSGIRETVEITDNTVKFRAPD